MRETKKRERERERERESKRSGSGGRWRRLQRRLLPPAPFSTLFALQPTEERERRYGDEGEERHFSQSRVLSTVISTKIRQRLAIVPNRARLHTLAQILPRFFSPPQKRGTYAVARIARARFRILRVGLSVPRAFYQMQMTPRNGGQL